MIDKTIRAANRPGVLRRRLSYLFQRDLLKKKTALASVGRFQMEVPIQEPGIARPLMIYGERELDQRHIIHSLLKEGDTVLDLGANMGYYCLLEAEAIGRSGKIYAVEPDKKNIERLRKNLQLNGITDLVHVQALALSNRNGVTKFHVSTHSNLSSIEKTRGSAHEAIVRRGQQHKEYVREIEVPVRDFGEFLESLPEPVDLVRMDIEGHEVPVLSSLVSMLERDDSYRKAPKAIVFEPHCWEYEEGHDLRPVLIRLQDFGYNISKLGSRNEKNAPMHRFGYKPYVTLKEKRGPVRGVYTDLRQEDAVELASRIDGVTTVCLQLGG